MQLDQQPDGSDPPGVAEVVPVPPLEVEGLRNGDRDVTDDVQVLVSAHVVVRPELDSGELVVHHDLPVSQQDVAHSGLAHQPHVVVAEHPPQSLLVVLPQTLAKSLVS